MAMTIEYAKRMLALWQECEEELASGQAKAYTVGTRSFTSVDLKEISARVQYWEDKVEVLSGEANGKRARRVVFRDL